MVQWDLTRFGPVRYFQVNRPVHRESWLEQGCGCDFKCSWCSLGEKSHLGGNLETSLIDFVQSQNHKHHGRNHSRIQILLAGVDLPHWSPMWIRFSHPRCKTWGFACWACSVDAQLTFQSKRWWSNLHVPFFFWVKSRFVNEFQLTSW